MPRPLRTKLLASMSESNVPVSSHAVPRGSTSTCSRPARGRPVDVGDLVLAARRRLEVAGDLDHVVVVEVQPRHRVVDFGCAGFSSSESARPASSNSTTPYAAGVGHPVGEDRAAVDVVEALQLAARGRGRRRCCRRAPARPARRRRTRRRSRTPGPARPGWAARRSVIEIPNCDPSPSSRSNCGRVLRRGDHQHVADARQHQRRQRVVDHRLVVDRDQLLADAQRDRMQPRPGAAGQDDPSHSGPVWRMPAEAVPGGRVKGSAREKGARTGADVSGPWLTS